MGERALLPEHKNSTDRAAGLATGVGASAGCSAVAASRNAPAHPVRFTR